MCCYKRLAMRIKRHAGWGRNNGYPNVTRPLQDEIDAKKAATRRGTIRNTRRAKAISTEMEEKQRNEFFKQKGWLLA